MTQVNVFIHKQFALTRDSGQTGMSNWSESGGEWGVNKWGFQAPRPHVEVMRKLGLQALLFTRCLHVPGGVGWLVCGRGNPVQTLPSDSGGLSGPSDISWASPLLQSPSRSLISGPDAPRRLSGSWCRPVSCDPASMAAPQTEAEDRVGGRGKQPGRDTFLNRICQPWFWK